MRLGAVSAAMVLLLWTGGLPAQVPNTERVTPIARQSADDVDKSSTVPSAEPTLPEVLVRPEKGTGVDSGVPQSVEGSGASSGPLDRPLTYPRLSEQTFGQGAVTSLDSVTRRSTSLQDQPQLGTIIRPQDLIERQPANMAEALQNEVGVLMQQTARGQVSPFVRGLTGQQVLILVDGIRMNNSVYRNGPNQYFNLIDPGQVQRIEVVRGPGSVLWGSDAIGGVINIVTKDPDFCRGDYQGLGFMERFSSADAGSYSRGHVEGWVGAGGLLGGASYLNVNDLDRGGDLGRQPYTGYQQYAADLKLNYLLDSETLLTVAVQHFEQEDLPRSDRFLPFVLGPPASTSRPTFYDPQQRDLTYLRLQGVATGALFDGYSTTFSYSRNKEASREERSTTRVDVGQFDVDTLGFTLALAKDLDWVGRLTYGTDYYYDDIDAFRNRVNPTNGQVTADNPQFPNGSRYRRFGVFLNWDVDVTERLTATAGVRYENDDATGTINQVRGTPSEFQRSYQDWIASAGLVYKLTDTFHLVGSVAEGYRAPNLDDLTADNPVLQDAHDLPSLDVEPEHAWTYEVGFRLDTPRLRLQVAEFWTDLENNILRQAVDAAANPVPNVIGPYGTLIPGSSNFVRANFDCYLYGTELTAEYMLEDGWSLYGNGWYTFGEDLERQEPLSRIPPLQGIVGIRWRERCHRRWIDMYTWLVARQDRYAAQNNIDSRFPLGGTPGYATLNLRTGTVLGRSRQHRLTLNLENITNKYYRVLGSGVDGAGFNAIVGYELLR